MQILARRAQAERNSHQYDHMTKVRAASDALACKQELSYVKFVFRNLRVRENEIETFWQCICAVLDYT